MKFKRIKGDEIRGHVDIFVAQNEDEFEGETIRWNEVLIHGDPEGLRSLAKLLNEIAALNQEKVNDRDLPVGEREHYHLSPGIELSESSVQVIVGRLDAKGSGRFYDRYVPKNKG